MGSPVPFGASPPTEISSEDRGLALAAHLIGCVTSVWGPLVIYLMKREQSPFVAYHAMQAMVFHTIAGVVVVSLVTVTCGFASPLVIVPWVVALLSALKAHQGEWAGYPLIDQIGRPPGV
jgi:uncharacterized Tic20 family protein